ncbi:MAG: OmpA family protein [Lentisphaeria bacterium]|nr:OmpA family protein [Lentisphaeria bacterium]
MKKSMILSGVLTLALAIFTTGCNWFESSSADAKDSFYRPLAKKNQAGGPGSESGSGPAAGNAELQGMGSGMEDANRPGEFGSGSGLGNTYDGFGTAIPGVTFNPVYFGFDQFAIGSGEMNKINDVVTYLNNNPGTGVVIEGNCDNRGTEEYNRALGERRALAAQEQILAAGIASNRVKTISNGKSKLAAQGDNEDAHKLNRRDEFIAVKLMK